MRKEKEENRAASAPRAEAQAAEAGTRSQEPGNLLRNEAPENRALAAAAVQAALSVPGVSSMSATVHDALRSTLWNDSPETQGVRISGGWPDISLDLYVNAAYGTQIPEAAWEVQAAVKEVYQDTFGVRPKEINIHVEGVEMGGKTE